MMPPLVGGVFFALGIKPEITPQLVDFPTYPRTLLQADLAMWGLSAIYAEGEGEWRYAITGRCASTVALRSGLIRLRRYWRSSAGRRAICRAARSVDNLLRRVAQSCSVNVSAIALAIRRPLSHASGPAGSKLAGLLANSAMRSICSSV